MPRLLPPPLPPQLLLRCRRRCPRCCSAAILRRLPSRPSPPTACFALVQVQDVLKQSGKQLGADLQLTGFVRVQVRRPAWAPPAALRTPARPGAGMHVHALAFPCQPLRRQHMPAVWVPLCCAHLNWPHWFYFFTCLPCVCLWRRLARGWRRSRRTLLPRWQRRSRPPPSDAGACVLCAACPWHARHVVSAHAPPCWMQSPFVPAGRPRAAHPCAGEHASYSPPVTSAPCAHVHASLMQPKLSWAHSQRSARMQGTGPVPTARCSQCIAQGAVRAAAAAPPAHARVRCCGCASTPEAWLAAGGSPPLQAERAGRK